MVRRQWRWLVVLVATGILAATPAVAARLPVKAPRVSLDTLLAAVREPLAPYQGYVESQGRLRLPDLDRTGDLADLFGASSKLRVWYRSPDAYRLDELDTTGEVDTYGAVGGTWTWNSNRRYTQWTAGATQLRLARALDITPPELGRRLVASTTTSTEVSSIAPARVAGRSIPGVRLRPRETTSTVDHADLWIDPSTGLTMRVHIVAVGDPHPALDAQFLEYSGTAPPVEAVTFKPPDGTRVDRDDDLVDVVQIVERRFPFPLPPTIAGLPRRTPAPHAVASYGTGFSIVDIAVVPAAFLDRSLPSTFAPPTRRPWGGDARVVETPLVNALTLTVGSLAYVLAGPVTIGELDRVASTLADTSA
jgi:hypothetical protein